MECSTEFRIQSAYANLRRSEQAVADFILKDMDAAKGYSLVELCSLVKVSQPTVIRFAKALGYEGYKEFREALLQEGGKNNGTFEPLFGFGIQEGDELGQVPAKTTASVVRLLKDSLKYISEKDYEAAVTMLCGAGTIDIYSVENSNATSCDLLNKLLYLGLKARFFQDSYLQHICAGHLKEGDVAVGISYTGRSADTVEALKLAKRSKAGTIAITNDSNSPILDYADVRLCASNQSTMVYGNAIFSRAPQLALVDMLYMGIILKDFKRFSKALDKSGRLIRGREIAAQ